MSALMEIIIRAIDKSSDVAKKVENAYKNTGDKIAQAMDKASNAGNKFTGTLTKVSSTGMSGYAQMTAKQQQYLQGLTKGAQLTDRLGLSGTTMGSKLASGVDRFDAALSKVKTKATQVGSTISSAIGRGLDAAKSKAESLTSSMGEMGTAVTSVFGALGLGSIYQATVGLGLAREQMTTLMTATMGSGDAAKSFVNDLDKMTNNSLVSLNDLGGALSKIKMSTGMTNDQLKLISPTVNDIGQRALLMGMDTQSAQDLMVASFRGLNGEFDMLKTNFGITRQNLIDAGWSGASTDVEGYNTALQKCLDQGGSMDGMLNTTTGQIQLVKKGFSTAGREIGETFLPAIKAVLGFMVGLKSSNPIVFKLMIVVAALVSAFALILPVLASVIGAFSSFLVFLGLIEGAEGATTIATIASTIATKAQAVASKAAAVAQILWNAAMDMNPIMLVVIAIVALVAILAYLYNNNEMVRNAINALWGGLQQLGGYIAGGLMAAWNAIGGTLSWIWGIITQVAGIVGGALLSAWNGITTALSPITTALGLLWAAISKVFMAFAGGKANEASSTFNQIASAASWLWGILSQVAGIIASALTPAFNVLKSILSAVAGFVKGAFSAAWTTISGIIGAVIKFIGGFITVLAGLISGQLTFKEAAMVIWTEFKGLVLNVFTSIMTGVGIFALSLLQKGIAAATGFVNGVISWITQLPGRIWTWLLLTITRILVWRAQLINHARSAGSGFITAFINFIKTLPARVWAYLLQTISRIASFASNARSSASSAASGIASALISGVSSIPGRMASWGSNIISSFINGIKARIGDLIGLLNYIKSFFPASPPKKGPLSKITAKNMAWFGNMLGTSMTSGLSDSTQDMFSDITDLSSSANVDLTSSTKFTKDTDTKTTIEVEHTFDLKNVPSGNSDKNIVDMLLEGIDNRKVIDKINVGLGKVASREKRSAGG